MEATFYDEAVNASNSQHDGAAVYGFNPKTLKQTMTLNLNDPKNFKPQLGAKALDILTSPDVGLLKLASPELERLIIQSCSGLTTPTPTQFICPKNVSDEQEGFAEGFVRALAELHYQQIPAAHPDAQTGGTSGVAPGSAPCEGGGIPYSCTAERKRMRNRVAASKCRKRKLERISRLEDRVKNLKTQNTELVSSANVLRDELALLKQKVMDHVNSGCQLILTQQLQAY
ncbi:hypothetical protein CCH79_00011299 [Gambusia affinis]|uniref:Transcription factor Jun n=1 Tax=Gambusia affinis TaxID=33528 RepID=A0A315VET5_GAMAF|nr:hypothetical protein CCH79_00011299 [Gambusia affinis]